VSSLSSNAEDVSLRRQLVVPLLCNNNENDENYDDEEEENYYIHRSTMTNNNHMNLFHRLVAIRYVSDCMPFIFYTILTNGKYTAFALISVYLAIISFWFPFWLLSFFITEYGDYITMIGSIFLIGRTIIRLIAFPGASQKIIKDIENEFAKYSVRMIETACTSIIDLATIFEPRDQSGEQQLDNRTTLLVPGLWRRVKVFRCRVIAVYIDVLRYMFQQQSMTSLVLSTSPIDASSEIEPNGSYGPELTRYGNNRLSGDVGNVLTLPVGFESASLLSILRSAILTSLVFFSFHWNIRSKYEPMVKNS
jgi:hypothetical protein